jgi:hypothetical protein
MQLNKRLRRKNDATLYKTKKHEMAATIADLCAKGHTTKSISEKYDIPIRVVERLHQEYLLETMPDLDNYDVNRRKMMSKLEKLLEHSLPDALAGDDGAYKLALQTLKDIREITGLDAKAQRQALTEGGVIRHEYSGSVSFQHGIDTEQVNSALEMFMIGSDGASKKKVDFVPNTHRDRTHARSLIDSQLAALPQADHDLPVIEVIDAEAVEVDHG